MPLSDPLSVQDAYAHLTLGFSDLDDDEAFLIWLYRHWQTSAATTDAAEQDLLARLLRDRIHGCLTAVFDLFRTVGRDPDMEAACAGAALLTPLEIGLLDRIANRLDTDGPFNVCAQALAQAGAAIRSPASLAPSDIDRIERRIADSYGALLRG